MVKRQGRQVAIRSIRHDDLERLLAGRRKLAEQGNLADHPDRELLRAQVPRWSKIRNGRINLGIEVDGRLIGEIQTFRPREGPADASSAAHEVGVSIYDGADRGKGLGAEAMRLFVTWLFEQGADQLKGSTAPANRAMRQVFERAGFTREDESLEPDVVRYTLSRPEKYR